MCAEDHGKLEMTCAKLSRVVTRVQVGYCPHSLTVGQ